MTLTDFENQHLTIAPSWGLPGQITGIFGMVKDDQREMASFVFAYFIPWFQLELESK